MSRGRFNITCENDNMIHIPGLGGITKTNAGIGGGTIVLGEWSTPRTPRVGGPCRLCGGVPVHHTNMSYSGVCARRPPVPQCSYLRSPAAAGAARRAAPAPAAASAAPRTTTRAPSATAVWRRGSIQTRETDTTLSVTRCGRRLSGDDRTAAVRYWATVLAVASDDCRRGGCTGR